MRKVYIYPSVLSADFSKLGEEIRTVEAAGADGIHLDVMDGHFVPNLTIGPAVVKSIRKISTLPYWAHLMIEAPEKFIEPFAKAGADGIFVHPETGRDMAGLIGQIHGLGIQAGIAVNPETSAEVLRDVGNRIERVLVMTVHPGFGGQTLLPEQLEKIRLIRNRLKLDVLIEVDGGVNDQTATEVVRAGADVLVAGNAIFGQQDEGAALHSIRYQAEKALSNPNGS